MTQRPWTGKLFAFRDEEGEHLSLVPPSTNGKMLIRAFLVRGPFIPISQQKTITLPDVERWLGDLRLQGFTCEPCTLDA